MITKETAALQKLDIARKALIEAKTLQEIKHVLDLATVAEIYAKQIGLADEDIKYAKDIKIEAERKLGSILDSMEKNKGAATKTNAVDGVDRVKTLKELGISKDLSADAQKIAKLDEDIFEDVKSQDLNKTEILQLAKEPKEKQKKIIQKIKEENLTGSEAIKAVKKEERKKDIEKQKKAIDKGLKTPTGKFDVIVLDPPWSYESDDNYDPETRRAANPFPSMSQDELLKIKLPSKDNSVIFLWTTHKHIWSAKELLDAYGYEYKATMVWDKGSIGMGVRFRYQCEFCLVGIKGKPFWSNTTHSEIIHGKRREHSRKPDEFYELIEEITAGEKLDYFSRERRDGWSSYGNDTDKFLN